MNQVEFQKQFSGELKQFFETPCGGMFLMVLQTMRPTYEFSQQEHLLVENRGAIRGYEACVRNAVVLASPPVSQKEPEISYGVSDKTQPINPK